MSGLVLYSDPHFSNRTAFGKTILNAEFPGCNSRFYEIAITFRRCVDYAIQNSCEGIVICGDIFHDRGTIAVPVYNAVYQLFKDASKKIPLILYPGNHDYVDLNAMHADKHLHSLFTYERSCTLQDKPGIVETDSFRLSIIPFHPEPKYVTSAADALTSTSIEKVNMLLMHHSFDGAVTGPHEWVMPGKLNPNVFPASYDLLFSGHYHCRQRVGDRLEYVGAPLQHDVGEREYTPGFVHVLPDGTWRQVVNNLSPRFNVIEACLESDISGVSSTDYTIIRWKGIQAVGESLRETNPGLLVEVTPSVSAPMRSDIKTTDNVEDMFEKYISAKFGLSNEPILKKGLRLYRGNNAP